VRRDQIVMLKVKMIARQRLTRANLFTFFDMRTPLNKESSNWPSYSSKRFLAP
jgi:hypothetical protein